FTMIAVILFGKKSMIDLLLMILNAHIFKEIDRYRYTLYMSSASILNIVWIGIKKDDRKTYLGRKPIENPKNMFLVGTVGLGRHSIFEDTFELKTSFLIKTIAFDVVMHTD
ncbi:hypothetical protein ACJX0J_006816, partial [Zea mays]